MADDKPAATPGTTREPARDVTRDRRPLGDLHVVDCSDRVAGQFTGRMFAGFGARVTLVEPPGGTTTRTLPPLATGPHGETRSLLFEHLNGAKASFVHDPDEADTALDALLARADVIIHDDGDDRFTGPARHLPASVVTCSVGDFPSGTAYAHWRAEEMIHQALCGTMYQTGAHDSYPLYGIGHRSEYAAGTTAFTAAMVALWERRRTGLGQHAAANVFESLAAMAENTVTLYGYSRTQPPRRPSDLLGTIRCADGWIVVFALTGWAELCTILGAPELIDDPRFARSRDRVNHWAAAVDAMNAAAADKHAADIVAACQERKIICEHFLTPGELVRSEQWRARGMVRTHDDPDAPVRHALGPMFRLDGDGWMTGPAPALDADRPADEPFDEPGDEPPDRRPRPVGDTTDHVGAPGDPSLPLAGLRVVDLTTAWSGPMATRGLAFFGAEVIKIEPPTRLDAWRGMYLGRTSPFFPDSDGGDRRYDRCCSFNTQAHDKASFGLDVTAPGGRETMLDLLARADVLIANYSSGVLDRLGFGHEAMAAVNPRLIVVEMPAFGAGGPLSRHVAMGSTMEAASAMGSLIGYGDGRPTLTGSTILDPIGGLNGTAAVLIALHRRARTGRGCHVEVAQTEVAAHWIGDALLAELEGVSVPAPDGNRVASAEPHDAYPCAGRDQWVAVSVPDDTAWHGLCTTLGEADLAEDPRFATPAARAANRDELAAIISAWTGRHTKIDAAAKLQATGCPAAPVNRGSDVFFDPALRATGFIAEQHHPAAGVSDYPGLAYRLSRTPGAIRTPAPLFGADNRRICTDVLGYDDMRIAELYAGRAICDEPYNPRKLAAAAPTPDAKAPDAQTPHAPTPDKAGR